MIYYGQMVEKNLLVSIDKFFKSYIKTIIKTLLYFSVESSISPQFTV